MNQVTEKPMSTADFVATGDREQERREERQENRPMETSGDGAGPLLPADFVQELRRRWDHVQTGFVDEPRQSVKQADELVAEAMKRIAEGFAGARNTLEHQWDRGDDVSTEDLRIALQKYRVFFQRLLSV